MKDDIMEFTIESADDGFPYTSYCELCTTLKFLDEYLNESVYSIMEALDDPKINRQGSIRKGIENTKEITRETSKGVNAVVDAKAGIFKAEAKLFLKLMNGIFKIIQIVAGKTMNLIDGITKLGTTISNIPGNIIKNIKGSITLNITVSDIELIYNNSIVSKIDSFINLFTELTTGTAWSSLLHPRKREMDGLKFTTNDIKLCKKIKLIASGLKNVTFTPTVVPLDNLDNVKLYFTQQKSVNFVDLYGKKHQDSYPNALVQLLRDLSSRKESIEKLQAAFGTKMTETQMNQSWSMIGIHNQETINGAMADAATVLGVVGNVYKCAYKDTEALTAAVAKVKKRYGADGEKAPSQKENKK